MQLLNKRNMINISRIVQIFALTRLGSTSTTVWAWVHWEFPYIMRYEYNTTILKYCIYSYTFKIPEYAYKSRRENTSLTTCVWVHWEFPLLMSMSVLLLYRIYTILSKYWSMNTNPGGKIPLSIRVHKTILKYTHKYRLTTSLGYYQWTCRKSGHTSECMAYYKTVWRELILVTINLTLGVGGGGGKEPTFIYP